ncbi:hypothetical protein NA57DRAFT_77045 [Rhizodiscina lignyota]|uniref:Uncharacterized protein n=1 Tax=Rhizodiscina lignyota TaxID=1504668 RepID=A0A9P4IDY4_9PEZI|nr:hypothetical protein NA57DRAFT_77045 [Rhizodiscina lignyota]
MPPPPPALRNALKVPYTSTFYFKYSKSYEPPDYLQLLVTEGNPIQFRVKASYEKRPRTGLWLSVRSTVNQIPKAIIRSHCRRKLRHAFRTALTEHGLDENGVKLSNNKGSNDVEELAMKGFQKVSQELSEKQSRGRSGRSKTDLFQPAEPSDLHGTLTLFTKPAILEATNDNVREDAGKLIRYLQRLTQADNKESIFTPGRMQLNGRSNRPARSSRPLQSIGEA